MIQPFSVGLSAVRGLRHLLATRVATGLAGCLVALVPLLHAQSASAPKALRDLDAVTLAEARAEMTSKLQQKNVTFSANDSSLGDVLRAVANQAGYKLWYDKQHSAYAKRITVNFRNRPVLEAFQLMLRGTGLTVLLSSDGETLVVKPASSRDTVRQDSTASGQVGGRIVDSATGKPVAGVTVAIVGSKATVITDDRGQFALQNIPVGTHTLTARIVGYRSITKVVEIKHDETTPIAIAMIASSTTLSEVVTTATGKQRRVEIGNDIATINVDSLRSVAPIRTVSDILAVSRIPGVTVEPTSGLPGAPSRIRVRGIGSIMGDNDPAVFVDGVRVSAGTSGKRVSSAFSIAQAQFITSRLDDIDPETIESIEILRGPSAGALYGTDAANGVIVITTKKATAGPARWNVRIAHDWNTPPGRGPTLYTGWGVRPTIGGPTTCNIAQVLARECTQDSVSKVSPLSNPLLTSEASGRNSVYTASVEGGVQRVRYNITTSFEDRLGPTKVRAVDAIRLRRWGVGVPSWLKRPDKQDRVNLTTTLMFEPNSGLDTRFTTQVIQLTRARNGVSNIGALSTMLSSDTLTGGPPETNRYTEDVRRIMLSAEANWNKYTWLHANVTGGLDRSTTTEINIKEVHSRCQQGSGCEFPTQKRGEASGGETVLSFNARGSVPRIVPNQIARWVDIQPTFGMNVTRLERGRVRLQVDTSLGGAAVGGVWTGSGNIYGDSSRSATAGFYADFRIGVLQRLYTSVGFRRDVGSAFGGRSGLQNYPKFNTSWLVSDEPFFPKFALLNTLRLRFAAGMSGVQPVMGAVDGGYLVSSGSVNGVIVPRLEPTILANPRLKPERGIEVEYGADIEAVDQRMVFGMTLARKNSRNVITQQFVPPSLVGDVIRRYDNIGNVVNRTLELSLDTRVVDVAGILWTVRAGLTNQINRVVSIGLTLDPNYLGTNVRVKEGYPIASRWERPVLSYFDENGDGLLSRSEMIYGDSMVYRGWAQPKYSLAYSTSFSIWQRRLTVTANVSQDVGLTQSIGRNYYGVTAQDLQSGLQDITAPLSEQAILKGCTSLTSCAGIPQPAQTFSVVRWNASSVSFDVPQSFVRTMGARSMAIQLTAGNLAYWTRYRGRDPSVNSVAGEYKHDSGDIVPPPKTFSMTVRFGL